MYTEEEIKLFKKTAKKFDEDWLLKGFELMREVIELCKITDSESPLFCMNIIENKGFTLTIGRRYVITLLQEAEVKYISLIMPLKFTEQEIKNSKGKDDIGYFYDPRGTIREARWVDFDRTQKVEFSNDIKNLWLAEVMNEWERQARCFPHVKRAHKRLLFDIVKNPSLFDKIMEGIPSRKRA